MPPAQQTVATDLIKKRFEFRHLISCWGAVGREGRVLGSRGGLTRIYYASLEKITPLDIRLILMSRFVEYMGRRSRVVSPELKLIVGAPVVYHPNLSIGPWCSMVYLLYS